MPNTDSWKYLLSVAVGWAILGFAIGWHVGSRHQWLKGYRTCLSEQDDDHR